MSHIVCSLLFKFDQKNFFNQKNNILDKFKSDNQLIFLWFVNVKTYLQAKTGQNWIMIQPMPHSLCVPELNKFNQTAHRVRVGSCIRKSRRFQKGRRSARGVSLQLRQTCGQVSYQIRSNDDSFRHIKSILVLLAEQISQKSSFDKIKKNIERKKEKIKKKVTKVGKVANYQTRLFGALMWSQTGVFSP